MSGYDEIFSFLGYLEARAEPPLPFLFHGCTGRAPDGILRDGLRYTREEPCLTYSPATALLKYANPVRCSRNFHSGLAAELARPFADGREAAAWYENRPGCGAVVIFPAGGVSACPAVSGTVSADGASVSGGITKWMHCHVSPGPGSGTLPSGLPAGILRPSAGAASALRRAARPESAQTGWEGIAEELVPVLSDPGRAELKIPVREAAAGIARCAVTAGMLDFLRQLALSAAARDRAVLKTDYPPETEAFPAPFAEDLPGKAALAERIRCRDPWLESVRAEAAGMLKEIGLEGSR